jgi:hypothetical protein
MFKLGDLQSFLKPNIKSWALIIPFGATLVPLFSLGRGVENTLSLLLAVPRLFYTILFVYSLPIWLEAWLKTNGKTDPNNIPPISNVSITYVSPLSR